MNKAFLDRIPGRVLSFTVPDETIYVLQITQGYDTTSKPQSSPLFL